jgi:hypothetical protein
MKQLPKVFSRTAALREQLPAATAPKKRGGGAGRPLQIVLPPEVVKQLKVNAAQSGTTVRHLVLQALRGAGYAVDQDQLGDRRSVGG